MKGESGVASGCLKGFQHPSWALGEHTSQGRWGPGLPCGLALLIPSPLSSEVGV